MSIFTRYCPNCGETSAASANTCQCGHILEADTDSLEGVQQVSQEEEVYEAYLAARLDQARLAAEKAIELLAGDPTDQIKANDADAANHALEEINAEYENQLESLENAQVEAEQARALARTEQVRLNAETLAKTDKLEIEKRKTKVLAVKRRQIEAKKNLKSRPLTPPKIISLSSETVSAALALEKPAHKPAVTQQRAITRGRTGRTRYDASEAILARRAAQQRISQKAEALASRRASQTEMPPKLKETMLVQAEKAVSAARSSNARISGDLAAAANALDARISNSNSIGSNKKECPNCTSEIQKNSKQCACGYQFNTGTESMPELSLSPKDLHEFF